jgi:hypothetical protein
MAVHPLVVELGPRDLKKMFFEMDYPAVPCGNFCVFICKAIYGSSSALNISGHDGLIVITFSTCLHPRKQSILHVSPGIKPGYIVFPSHK